MYWLCSYSFCQQISLLKNWHEQTTCILLTEEPWCKCWLCRCEIWPFTALRAPVFGMVREQKQGASGQQITECLKGREGRMQGDDSCPPRSCGPSERVARAFPKTAFSCAIGQKSQFLECFCKKIAFQFCWLV